MNIIGLDEGMGTSGETTMGLIVGKGYELSRGKENENMCRLAYRLTSSKGNPVIPLPTIDNAQQRFAILDISCIY